MNLLITGDSFAADWTKKYPQCVGWPNLLSNEFNVTNIAQAGCSEYKIYKQLLSVNLSNYDCILISHTSPYRIYTEYNPIRHDDLLHHHCDLLYSDVKELASSHSDYASVVNYFEKFFSLEFADYIYKKIRQDIDNLVNNHQAIQISHMTSIIPVDIDFSEEYKVNPGQVNHYNCLGNQHVFQRIRKEIKK